MTCRAKFSVASDTQHGYAGQSGPVLGHREIRMQAVYDDGLVKENASFAKATPSGNLTFNLDNPALAGMFKAGEVYYLDFTKVEGA